MKRLLVGPAVLAASLTLWSCSGDPTGAFRNGAATIDVQPTSLFVTNGAPKTVVVQVLDDQGNPLPDEVTVTQGAGVQVDLDTTYLRTSREGDKALVFQHRYVVTPTQLTSTSFTFSAGGVSRDVPVRVVPNSNDTPLATVASTGPNPNDTTNLTVPAPFQFPADATVKFVVGADSVSSVIVGRSSDGRTLQIFAPPGSAAIGAVNLAVDYLPSASLPTTTDVPVTVATTVPPQSGTDDPATAPVIAIPPAGGSAGFFAPGSFGAGLFGADRIYQFTLTEAADITTTVNWSNDADVDVALCSDAACANDPNFDAATGDQPESTTYSLEPGTYYLILNLFDVGSDGNPPAWLSVQLQR